MRKIQRAIFFLTPGILMRFLAKKCENIAKSRQKMIPANAVIFAEKMWEAFASAKATHIFSKNINIYAIFNDKSFIDTLTNDMVNFGQLSPGVNGCATRRWRSWSDCTNMLADLGFSCLRMAEGPISWFVQMYHMSSGYEWVRQRCRVSYITGASSWYWLTVGQGLLYPCSR